MKTILIQRKNNMHAGDAYLVNDPYHGGTHLPDVTVVVPLFIENHQQPLFYLGARAHQADIGGISPGSVPAMSQRIEQEGIVIDNFKLVDQGRFCEQELIELLTQHQYPVRNVQQNIADLRAQLAATQRGKQELLRAIKQYGLDVVLAYMQHIQDNAQLCVRRVIDRLHDGSFTTQLDNNCEIKVAIRVDKQDRSAVIDFSGTSPQQLNNNFNAPTAVTYAAVLYVFRCLVHDNIPLNHGCLLPLDIVIPENSLLNPSYPCAVVAGNVETSQAVVDTLLGALQVCAASQGTMNNFSFGNDTYQYYETICGGVGAMPNYHGASAVHSHMTNSFMTDPEVLEYRYPIRIEAFSIRKYSGGKGQWHGGDGARRQIRFLQDMQASIISNRRVYAPYGMQGGEDGHCGENWLLHVDGHLQKLPGVIALQVEAGQSIIIETPGGGGWGSSAV